MQCCSADSKRQSTTQCFWCGVAVHGLAEARNFYVLCTIIYVDSFFIRYIYYILSPFCTVLKKMESLQDLCLSTLKKNISKYDLREACEIRLCAKNIGVTNKKELKAWDHRILDISERVRNSYSCNITHNGRCYYRTA